MKKLLFLSCMALFASLSMSSCIGFYPVPVPPRVVYRTPPPPPRYNPPPHRRQKDDCGRGRGHKRGHKRGGDDD